tara:strand:- start:187 stop:981 length:795 start_codon:yes stop_codon:yes gene_type:complete
MQFFKYNSCGNNFIIIDDRENTFSIKKQYIKRLCDRNFGVGADGLILLQSDKDVNYFMNYFNSDGAPASFCGNGSMCCGHFAHSLGILNKDIEFGQGLFKTREGTFSVSVRSNTVSISMPDVSEIKQHGVNLIIDTGSPHYIIYKDNLEIVDVFHEGMRIRSSEEFRSKGVNVTFIQRRDKEVFIRTYERGVESETLSCGTAVVAAAISIFKSSNYTLDKFVRTTIKTRGGIFHVKFKYESKNQAFTDIFLSNQVNVVFEGKVC